MDLIRLKVLHAEFKKLAEDRILTKTEEGRTIATMMLRMLETLIDPTKGPTTEYPSKNHT